MAIYTQSSIFSEYHRFPSSGADRNFVGTRVHDNVTTIYLVNEGDADVLLRFYPKDTPAFDLNTISNETFKIPANSVKTLSVGTGTSSPGARQPLYSIETGGNTTDLFVSYVCRCVP